MKHLREISRIISEGSYDPEIIGDKTGWTPKFEDFYTQINDRTTIHGDTSFDNEGRIRKHRIRKRLLNSLFLLNPKASNYSKATEAFYECNKRIFFVKILIRFSARGVAWDLARRTLPIAQRFEVTNAELEMTMALRSQAHLTGCYADFFVLDSRVDELLEIQRIENFAVRSYERVTIGFVKHMMSPDDTAGLSLEYARRLESSVCFDRYAVRLIHFRLMVIHYQITGRFDAMIKQCRKALGFLDRHPDQTVAAFYAEFHMQRVIACIFMKEYALGDESVTIARASFASGTNNWFEFMQFVFLLRMHSGRFRDAEQVLVEVTEHTRFQTLETHVREKWKIFEMYLQCLDADPPSTFNLYAPTYAKDKPGFNVALIVVQLLYLVQAGKLSDVTERIEALKTYKSRYLIPKYNPKAAVFFRMILLFEKEEFNFKKIKSRSVPWFKRLMTIKPSYSDITDGMQVLPYEDIWEELMKRLEAATERQRLEKMEELRMAKLSTAQSKSKTKTKRGKKKRLTADIVE